MRQEKHHGDGGAHAHHDQGGGGQHTGHEGIDHGSHGEEGEGHAHTDHTGHEQMFRQRFWVNLVLTVPVLLFSPMLQQWFGFSMPEFPGSRWIGPVFAVAIFFYGGLPFLQMALPELRSRKPGMMTLISLAITVAFVYSLFALFFDPEGGFFWEMATLMSCCSVTGSRCAAFARRRARSTSWPG
jgi:Cu2+-exporting ATPase